MAGGSGRRAAKRKRRDADDRRKLLVGEHVEVCYMEEGFTGSWHLAVVVKCGKFYRVVEHDNLLNDDMSVKIVEKISVSAALEGNSSSSRRRRALKDRRDQIRPFPPGHAVHKSDVRYGLCVDALVNEAWWEGVIFDHQEGSEERIVFFPDLGDQDTLTMDRLRLTQEWNGASGDWTHRGEWSLLQLLQDLNQEKEGLPISVRQIWYDLRTKPAFMEGVKAWYLGTHDAWRPLVSELFQELWSVLHDRPSPEVPAPMQLKDFRIFYRRKNKIDLVNAPHRPPSVAGDSSNPTKRARFRNACSRMSSPLSIADQQAALPGKIAARTSKHVANAAGSSMLRTCTCLQSQNSILHIRDADSKVFRYVTRPESQNTNLCVGLQHAAGKKVDAEFEEAENIHPEYLPEAIKEYEDYFDSDKKSIKEHVSTVNATLLRLNARKHLLYMGWHFWLKGKKAKDGLCYAAPDGRIFRSLAQACKEYLKAEWLRNNYVRPQAQMKSTVKSSDSSNVQIKHAMRKTQKCQFSSISNLLASGNQVYAKSSEFPDIRSIKSPSGGPRSSKTKHGKKTSLRLHKRTQQVISSPSGGPRSSKMKRRKKTSLRLHKRTQQVISSLTKDSVKTVLSWLIERNALFPRQNVFCICKDGISKKKGRISGHEIKCTCCGQLFTLAKFEAHANCKTSQPCTNIFLNDGRSLLQCQIEIMSSSRYKDSSHKRIKSDYCHYPSDVICSICHYGGDLILCDHCPSSFHISCVGLKKVPEGKWFCPSCRCSLCGVSEYNHDIIQFTKKTMLYCDQCKQEYHVGCLNKKRSQQLSSCPTKNWFCSKRCSKIYRNLSKLLGKSHPVSIDGLSWKILRWNRSSVAIDSICPETMAAIHTKLSIALDVLHECFVTIIEPRTQSDLSADIVFNKESELNRLNFWGFYTMLLEKGDEMVSVATFRVYDRKVAEMPLIGTCVKFREQGMCRLLLGELEKLLCALRVERLLLPSIPRLLETWTTKFGFTKLENSDRIQMLKYPIVNFQGTTMCQKLLR